MRAPSALLAFAAMLPGTALAIPVSDGPDTFGARAIARGETDGIETRLASAVSRGDRRPEVLLNLAAIRAGQSDVLGADRLYRMVLAAPNVDMATLAGTAWSHDIARRGLASRAYASVR